MHTMPLKIIHYVSATTYNSIFNADIIGGVMVSMLASSVVARVKPQTIKFVFPAFLLSINQDNVCLRGSVCYLSELAL